MSFSKLPNQNSTLLHKLYTNKLLTDVDLIVDGEVYSGHRAILSATSEYFFNMFTGNMIEKSLSSIPLSGVSTKTFKILFRFIYGESDNFIVEKLRSETCSVDDLLHAADMFQVEPLKNIITNYVIGNLDEENILAVYLLGWKYNIQRICEKTCLRINVPKLMKSVEFNRMKLEHLKSLMCSPYLQCTETEKCKAILGWLEFDALGREKDFDKAISLFCYHDIECDFRFRTLDRIYEKRNRKRNYGEACEDNPYCPNNCPEPVKTKEELSNLFGDRCYHLPRDKALMNTFTCLYNVYEGRIPNKMRKTQLYEKKEKRNEFESGFQKIPLEEQLRYGDHHVEMFHQGTKRDADHLIILTANYKVVENRSLSIFYHLPKVRLIIDDGWGNKDISSIPNPKYLHKDDEKRMHRYPLMFVIGGCEVNMDDAVRFACSLFIRHTGSCDSCIKGGLNLSHHCRYINIWSPSLEKKRAIHFGHQEN